jgi:hypothetical protein
MLTYIEIFGIMNPTQQGADILASQLGARVAMPDFFKGKPWELNKFPPPDRDEFLGLSRRITGERAKRRAESGATRNWKVSGIGRTDLGSEMSGTYV